MRVGPNSWSKLMSKKSVGVVVQVVIDERRWRGLEFQAELMTGVFGKPVTAQDLVQDMVRDRRRKTVGARR
jgi:hypothetical protein